LDLSILGTFSLVFLQLAKTQGNVFATDAILATLMSCTRSVYSWDIVVQRVGSKLFFDKRDNSDFGKERV
jgi:translation initiation factor 3 subunit D